MGYFLANNACFANPLPAILNCTRYQNQNISACLECAQGYHLPTSALCVLNTAIPNCSVFSTTSQTTQCVQCTAMYFLLNPTTCQLRSNFPYPNCNVASVTQDICETCNSNFVLITNSCVAALNNCTTHGQILDGFGNFTTQCVLCNSGFFFNTVTNSCEVGGIANCDTYQINSNICMQCLPGFYLNNLQCLQHTVSIPNCDQLSFTVANSCQTCDFTSTLVQNSNICVPLNTILDCAEYSDLGSCSLCNLGFFLENNQCLPIPPGENCLRRNAASLFCQVCVSGYLNIQGVCSPIPLYQRLYCDDLSTDGVQSTFRCNKCQQFAFPVNLQNQYVCTEAENSIPNCQKQRLLNNTQVCEQCDPNYVLSTNRLACLLECPENQTLFQSYFSTATGVSSEITYKICLQQQQSIFGCLRATIDARFDQNVCIECRPGFITTLACGSNGYDLGVYRPSVGCLNPVGVNYDFFPPNQTNCAAYAQSTIEPNTLLCKRCAFGFTGRIFRLNNSETYVDCSTRVNNCDAGVELGGSQLSTFVDEFFGTTFNHLLTCHKCLVPGQIPFIHLNNDGSMAPYSLSNGLQVPTQLIA